MGYSKICFRMAHRQVREGEPAMVLVQFEFCLLFHLTDLSSYQIEMNQSQRKKKQPSRSRQLSKNETFDMCACLHVSTDVVNSNPETAKKHFDVKLEENHSIYNANKLYFQIVPLFEETMFSSCHLLLHNNRDCFIT